MTPLMNQLASADEHLWSLTQSMCDGTITEEDRDSLEALLRASDRARLFYAAYIDLHGRMLWRFRGGKGDAPAAGTPQEAVAPPADPLMSNLLVSLPTTTLHGTFGILSSGWPVAYLIATVIFGIGLVIGALVRVSDSVQVVEQSPSVTRERVYMTAEPKMELVGRITGMVDCKWVSSLPSLASGGHHEVVGAGGEGSLQLRSPVRLHDRFALASGLLEITYDTGAKVILQGPVVYAVESGNGGFLSIGKLTGKVTTKAASGLTIRTLTAIVTDLGTEFGVEVSKEGNTVSHVFRGAVRLQTVSSNGKANGNAQVLHENESARVENGDKQGSNRIVMFRSDVKLADFVRSIPEQRIKTLDLVDILAGGDGFSGRRGRGINPTNGRVANTEVLNNPTFGDGKYHLVDELPFVDGVFIPNGGKGPVQLDSAGHVFADCPVTDNKTSSSLWAGQAGNNSAELDGINYALPGHGCLAIVANQGVTFDLAAIRKANPGSRLMRFSAVAGNTEHVSEKGHPVWADVWVLIDGEVRFRRREITRYNGAIPITVPIGANDRFLTLVATDGGNGYGQDHIMFGDPRLDVLPTEGVADTTPPRAAAQH